MQLLKMTQSAMLIRSTLRPFCIVASMFFLLTTAFFDAECFGSETLCSWNFDTWGDREEWTHQTLGLGYVDDWEWGISMGRGGDPDSNSSIIFGNDLGKSMEDGRYDMSSKCCLRSPPVQNEGFTNLKLQFSRWLTLHENDTANIRMLDQDLQPIQLVWNNVDKMEIKDQEWKTIDLPLSDLPSHQIFYIQFELISNFDDKVAGGWNIDLVKIIGDAPDQVTIAFDTPDFLTPGTDFFCNLEITNDGPDWDGSWPILVALEFGGIFYFAPSFGLSFQDNKYWREINKGSQTIEIIEGMITWPSGAGDGSANWYALVMDLLIREPKSNLAIQHLEWVDYTPTPTPLSNPTPTPFPSSTPIFSMTIQGDTGSWLNSGFELQTGIRYRLSLSGEICFYDAENDCLNGDAKSLPSGWCNNENTCTNAAYCELFNWECGPEPGKGFDKYIAFPHAALLIKQGDGSESDPNRIFRATDGFPGGKASYSGPMYVLINDHKNDDNTGSYRCEVSR